ncbi:helix-turn-helix transcriptional regulator [Pandoraea apista]|uniref:DNA-binding protein n=1 Tax=Pandoraea apista TaxID=93218 RepID=A0A5E5P080_9BURK|nr:PAS domain-containing protein [Pandoraea apista]OXS95697.1 DNA-binding protein [Pandoraea apista]VVG69887.1 DNA-binding protein [Pandoraea apista]
MKSAKSPATGKLDENALLLREGRKIVEALGQTFAPLVEVVLHDLTDPDHAIVAIANNLSGREPGDAVTEMGLARIADPAFPEVIANYANRFPDGRPAKSTSIGLKNSSGEYVAAICLNMDISMLAAAAASVQQLVSVTNQAPAPVRETLSNRRLDDISPFIADFAAQRNTTPQGLSLAQRREAIRLIEARGLLDLRHAHAEVARALGVARSTVYTYLSDPKGAS